MPYFATGVPVQEDTALHCPRAGLQFDLRTALLVTLPGKAARYGSFLVNLSARLILS